MRYKVIISPGRKQFSKSDFVELYVHSQKKSKEKKFHIEHFPYIKVAK